MDTSWPKDGNLIVTYDRSRKWTTFQNQERRDSAARGKGRNPDARIIETLNCFVHFPYIIIFRPNDDREVPANQLDSFDGISFRLPITRTILFLNPMSFFCGNFSNIFFSSCLNPTVLPSPCLSSCLPLYFPSLQTEEPAPATWLTVGSCQVVVLARQAPDNWYRRGTSYRLASAVSYTHISCYGAPV